MRRLCLALAAFLVIGLGASMARADHGYFGSLGHRGHGWHGIQRGGCVSPLPRHGGVHAYRHGTIISPPILGHPPVIIPFPGHPPVVHPPIHHGHRGHYGHGLGRRYGYGSKFGLHYRGGGLGFSLRF
jgi:hypothetical protein